MTPYSVIRYVDNIQTVKLIDENYKIEAGEFIVTICSLEQCGYSEQLATPRTLDKASKRIGTKIHISI